LTTIEPKVFPTFRTFWFIDKEAGRKEYEEIAFLIKKYGCPVSKVSDGEDWLRIYFDIPLDVKDEMLGEMDNVFRK
jgi:hypothetical protein